MLISCIFFEKVPYHFVIRDFFKENTRDQHKYRCNMIRYMVIGALYPQTPVLPVPSVYELVNDNWEFAQYLGLPPHLNFSGLGEISKDTIFQLAYNSDACFGVFYEEVNGMFQPTQSIQMDSSFEAPCQTEFEYVTIFTAMNGAVAATLELFNSGKSGSLSIFRKNT